MHVDLSPAHRVLAALAVHAQHHVGPRLVRAQHLAQRRRGVAHRQAHHGPAGCVGGGGGGAGEELGAASGRGLREEELPSRLKGLLFKSL